MLKKKTPKFREQKRVYIELEVHIYIYTYTYVCMYQRHPSWIMLCSHKCIILVIASTNTTGAYSGKQKYSVYIDI